MNHIETTEEIVVHHTHISWGAIFAGWLLASAIAMLLYFLGSAIGVTAINVSEGEAINKGLAVGTVAWIFTSWIVSLFLGGLFASWLHGESDTKIGTVEGMTVWGLASILTVVLGISGVSALFQAGQLVGKSMGAVGLISVTAPLQVTEGEYQDPASQQLFGAFQQEIKEVVSQAVANTSGESVSEQEVNLAIDQLDRNTIAAIGTSLIRGNPEEAKNILASHTTLSRPDIDQITQGLSQKADQLRSQIAYASQKAADYATTAMWALFFSSALGLLAAALGGRTGSRYAQHQLLLRERTV